MGTRAAGAFDFGFAVNAQHQQVTKLKRKSIAASGELKAVVTLQP
jgi:hypothetical protein